MSSERVEVTVNVKKNYVSNTEHYKHWANIDLNVTCVKLDECWMFDVGQKYPTSKR